MALQDSLLLFNLIFFYNFSKMYTVHKFGPFPQVSYEAVTIISTAGFPAFYYAFKTPSRT